MATTTNYSWTTPDDTALVKDGASAIRSLGTSIDTTTKALNPSTTLGDIEYRSSTANTNTRLGIGSTGQVLTVSGGVPAWATASSGGMTLLSSGSIGSSGIDLTSISSSYQELKLKLMDIDVSTACAVYVRLNNGSGTDYYQVKMRGQNGTSGLDANSAATYQQINYESLSATANGAIAIINLPNYADTTGYKVINITFNNVDNASTNASTLSQGFWKSETAVDRITVGLNTGSFDAGATYALYGVK